MGFADTGTRSCGPTRIAFLVIGVSLLCNTGCFVDCGDDDDDDSVGWDSYVTASDWVTLTDLSETLPSPHHELTSDDISQALVPWLQEVLDNGTWYPLPSTDEDCWLHETGDIWCPAGTPDE